MTLKMLVQRNIGFSMDPNKLWVATHSPTTTKRKNTLNKTDCASPTCGAGHVSKSADLFSLLASGGHQKREASFGSCPCAPLRPTFGFSGFPFKATLEPTASQPSRLRFWCRIWVVGNIYIYIYMVLVWLTVYDYMFASWFMAHRHRF